MKDLLSRQPVPVSSSVVSPNIQNDPCPIPRGLLHVHLVVSFAEGTLEHFGFLRAYYHACDGLLEGLPYLVDGPCSGT